MMPAAAAAWLNWDFDHKMKSQFGLRTNSKWTQDLNVRPETIKLLEENIGRTLNEINQSKILYDHLLE